MEDELFTTSLTIQIEPLHIADLRWTPSARFLRSVGTLSNHCCFRSQPTNSTASRPLSLAQSRYPEGRSLAPTERPIVEPEHPSNAYNPETSDQCALLIITPQPENSSRSRWANRSKPCIYGPSSGSTRKTVIRILNSAITLDSPDSLLIAQFYLLSMSRLCQPTTLPPAKPLTFDELIQHET